MTDLLPVDDPGAPTRAAALIKDGRLIVLPTDTVYGLAADTWQPAAVAAIYAAKRRPPEKAIPILIADIEDALQVAHNIPPAARRLAEAFWPGPLTIALPKRPDLPEVVSAFATVGVRIPNHADTRAVIRACGGALAVTSANLSEQPPAQNAAEAAALGDAVALILDGGAAPGGVPSTVVSFEAEQPVIVRQGPISLDMLLGVL